VDLHGRAVARRSSSQRRQRKLACRYSKEDVEPQVAFDAGYGYSVTRPEKPPPVKIVNDLTADKKGHPHRFGNEKDKGERGWSDHFPVSVRLKVAGK
jgi:hypothetical protein